MFLLDVSMGVLDIVLDIVFFYGCPGYRLPFSLAPRSKKLLSFNGYKGDGTYMYFSR